MRAVMPSYLDHLAVAAAGLGLPTCAMHHASIPSHRSMQVHLAPRFCEQAPQANKGRSLDSCIREALPWILLNATRPARGKPANYSESRVQATSSERPLRCRGSA